MGAFGRYLFLREFVILVLVSGHWLLRVVRLVCKATDFWEFLEPSKNKIVLCDISETDTANKFSKVLDIVLFSVNVLGFWLSRILSGPLRRVHSATAPQTVWHSIWYSLKKKMLSGDLHIGNMVNVVNIADRVNMVNIANIVSVLERWRDMSPPPLPLGHCFSSTLCASAR